MSHFPEIVDCFEDGVFRKLLYVGPTPVLLEVEQHGTPHRATLQAKLSGKAAQVTKARDAVERVLERVLGARTDVRPFYRRFGDDALLGPLIRDFRGLRVAGRASVWEALIQVVLSQQINLAFAHSILCELARSLGRRARFDGTLYFTFPSPATIARLTENELRDFRLSRGKANTLLGLAKAFQSRQLSEEKLAALPDNEAIELLTSFKGVGRWTAEFTLLRGLNRLDVFPGGDLGVVKYFARDFLGQSSPALEGDMRKFAERWRPYRGLALMYTYAELARRLRRSEK